MSAGGLLIHGGAIVTMDAENRVLDRGAVALRNGRILAIGTLEEVEPLLPGARRIDAAGRIVMPGLIDAHAHAGHGLIKTLLGHDGDAWEALCGRVYTTGSDPEFWRAEARLAALERLRFGVTTGVSLLGGGDTIMRSDDPAYAAAHCEGVAEIGTRSIVAIGPTRAPHPLTYADAGAAPRAVDFARQFDTSCRVADEWHGAAEDRIRIALLYPVLRDHHQEDMAPKDYADACEQARIVADEARRRGLVFTQDGHTRGSVARAHELGLLGPNALLSHATELTDHEIAICAETGTAIAHNPSAVASILGRCPAVELMAAGVTVALGSDATAPDRSGDMFRHIQQVQHYHRRHYRDPAVLPPGQALRMATVHGARALGLEDQLGSIEPGKRADLILVDATRPHMAPAQMPAARLAAFANGNDVETVIIGGEIVLEGRRATRVDEAEIIAEAERQAALMMTRNGGPSLAAMPPGFWGPATGETA